MDVKSQSLTDSLFKRTTTKIIVSVVTFKTARCLRDERLKNASLI